jgi:hypothetical protein
VSKGLTFAELLARTGAFVWQTEHLAEALRDEQRRGRVAFDGGRYRLTEKGLREVGEPLLRVPRPKEPG